MSDKKAEGFEEWYYEKMHTKPDLNTGVDATIQMLYQDLTEKYEKEIYKLESENLNLRNGFELSNTFYKLQAANKKLELLIKCDMGGMISAGVNGEIICYCQGCKNKKKLSEVKGE